MFEIPPTDTVGAMSLTDYLLFRRFAFHVADFMQQGIDAVIELIQSSLQFGRTVGTAVRATTTIITRRPKSAVGPKSALRKRLSTIRTKTITGPKSITRRSELVISKSRPWTVV
jgi:hypothetical protein